MKIKIHKDSDSRLIKSSPPRTDSRKRKSDTDVKGMSGESMASPIESVCLDTFKKQKRESTKRRDYGSLLKYFFKDSCYFVLKSNNAENVQISKREGVWSTPPQNEIKLNCAFKEFRNVILLFSVKESGRFQGRPFASQLSIHGLIWCSGFARLSSEANYNLEPVNWVLPYGVSSCPFGGVFYVDWICKSELSFTKTSHLFNPFNEGKPVKIARDGQVGDPLPLSLHLTSSISGLCRKSSRELARSCAVSSHPMTRSI